MIGYIAGVSDTDDIIYCPICGESVYSFYSDGTAYCKVCGKRFGVIIVEED